MTASPLTRPEPIGYRDLLNSIRREWTEETGVETSAAQADAILENLIAAFREMAYGAGFGYAVHRDPTTARYLLGRYGWHGEERRKLLAGFMACWCGEAGAYVVPVNVACTPPNAIMSDGEPGMFVCAEHCDRDGFEAI